MYFQNIFQNHLLLSYFLLQHLGYNNLSTLFSIHLVSFQSFHRFLLNLEFVHFHLLNMYIPLCLSIHQLFLSLNQQHTNIHCCMQHNIYQLLNLMYHLCFHMLQSHQSILELLNMHIFLLPFQVHHQ